MLGSAAAVGSAMSGCPVSVVGWAAPPQPETKAKSANDVCRYERAMRQSSEEKSWFESAATEG